MGFLAYIYKRKDTEEIGCEDVGQIQMVQDMVQFAGSCEHGNNLSYSVGQKFCDHFFQIGCVS